MSELDKDKFIAKYGTEKDVDKALDDKDYDVRVAAIQNINATKDHITKALNDNSMFVRLFAIQHNNITKEHFKKSLSDESYYVREVAKDRLNSGI